MLHRPLLFSVRRRSLTEIVDLATQVTGALTALAAEPEALHPGAASIAHWSRCLQLMKQPRGALAAWQVHLQGIAVFRTGTLDPALERNIVPDLPPPLPGRGRAPTSITAALAEPLPIFHTDVIAQREKWAGAGRASSARDGAAVASVRGPVAVQPPADDHAKKVAADRTRLRAAAATWSSLDAAERAEICTVSVAELTEAVTDEARRQGCLPQALRALESMAAKKDAPRLDVEPYVCCWCGLTCAATEEIVAHVHAAHSLPLCVIEADGPVTPCLTRASYGKQPLQRLKPSVLARPAFCWHCKEHIYGACFTGDRRRSHFVRGDDGQIHPSIMCCKCFKENPKAHRFISERFDPSERPLLHDLLRLGAADAPPYGRSKLTPLPPDASSAAYDEHEAQKFIQHALGSWAYDRGSAKQMASNRLRPEEVTSVDPSLEDLTAGCSTANDMVHLLKQQAKHLEGTPLRDAQLGLMRSCVDTLMDLIVGTLVRCPAAPVPLSKALMKQMIDHVRPVTSLFRGPGLVPSSLLSTSTFLPSLTQTSANSKKKVFLKRTFLFSSVSIINRVVLRVFLFLLRRFARSAAPSRWPSRAPRASRARTRGRSSSASWSTLRCGPPRPSPPPSR